MSNPDVPDKTAPSAPLVAPVVPLTESVTPRQGNKKRKRALLGVTGLVLVCGVAYGIYWALVLNHFETTDNAYVQGNIVQITPQVGGTVVAINADDTDHVTAGEVLIKLDPADSATALDQAEAQLAQIVRESRTVYANNSTYKAQIAARAADLAGARSAELRAQDDVDRRKPLVATGAVGREEFSHTLSALTTAKSNVVAAQAAVTAARQQLTSNETLTKGVEVSQNPNVLRAAARVREAYLTVRRGELPSPIDGFVAKRSVQLGQRVQAGSPMMSVIALSKVWVEANFKESQLTDVRIGQPVTLEADIYGGGVVYHGSIEGLGAGTGAAFALLPAQNATGNWIKIVQRVPVRIRLDPKELVDHPLRVGLSMEAKVDIADTRGAMLTSGKDALAATKTSVYHDDNSAADAEVARIIRENGGETGSATSPTRPSKRPAKSGTRRDAGSASPQDASERRENPLVRPTVSLK